MPSNTPLDTSYRPPQLLGDEQSRLIRTEEMTVRIDKLMNELKDELRGISSKLTNLEQNRAVSEVRATNNAEHIATLEQKLVVTCDIVNDLKSDLKGYKFTGNLLKVFIGILFSGVVWLIATTMAAHTIAGNNAIAIGNLKDSTTEIKTRVTVVERGLTELQVNGVRRKTSNPNGDYNAD